MNGLVADHGVHALGWNLVLSQLGCQLSMIVIRLETAVVFQNGITVCLFMVDYAIILSLESLLARLQHRVWLISESA